MAENQQGSDHLQNDDTCSPASSSSVSTNNLQFKWQKVETQTSTTPQSQTATSSSSTFKFGEILHEDLEDASAFTVFEKVCKFDEFIEKIVLLESIFYSQQQGHVLHITAEELKAYFGMNIVMGYHVLPSIRDYWSLSQTWQYLT